MHQTIEEKRENLKFSEVLAQLTKNQLRYVVAMQECVSKKEAAELLKIPLGTIYNWPPIVDEAIRLMALDITESAREMRKRALAKAIAVKVAGLESSDESIRQKSATEIIEAELGRPKQAMDITSDGERIAVTIKGSDD